MGDCDRFSQDLTKGPKRIISHASIACVTINVSEFGSQCKPKPAPFRHFFLFVWCAEELTYEMRLTKVSRHFSRKLFRRLVVTVEGQLRSIR